MFGPRPQYLDGTDSAIQQSKNRGQISKHMDSGSSGMFKPSFHMENRKTSDPNFSLISMSSEHCLCSTEGKHSERQGFFGELSKKFTQDCPSFHESVGVPGATGLSQHHESLEKISWSSGMPGRYRRRSRRGCRSEKCGQRSG